MSTGEASGAVNEELFNSVSDDVSQVHMYWKIYRQLFAHSDQRIALLNESGSMVFYVLQHLLLDSVTLAICRLTDPAMTGKKENHSLQRLVDTVEDEELRGSLKTIMGDLRECTRPFRDRRNLALAHSDLNTKLKWEEEPLPGISRDMVEKVLKAIRDLMNTYSQHCFKSMTFYEELILSLGVGGEFLSRQLRRAIAFQELEQSGDVDRSLWEKGRYSKA